MKKKFILDTSVLLHNPNSIFNFGDNEVILPITVIEELDNFKKDQREVGRNARQVARILNKYLDEGDIKKGVQINDNEGILRVDIRYTIEAHNADLPLDYNVNDNRIINCAYINDAVIISRDTNLRIMASAYGIPSEDYRNDKVDVDDMYTGTGEFTVTQDMINQIYDTNFIPVTDELSKELYPNQFILLKSSSNTKQSALARYNAPMKELRLLSQDQKTMGLLPRNKEQQYALDALTDPDIKLVTLVGKAGCGKSLMALVAGLQGVVEHKLYKKLLVYRPIVPMGNDIGYLPGSMEEKLAPWMQPISDNIDFIMGDMCPEDKPKIKKPKGSKVAADIPNLDHKTEKSAGKISATAELQQWGLLELGATTFIRGRSIPNNYIIFDEAQNASIHEIKTMLTRVGEGTKIILTGDPSQIDSPYLDSTNNGLTYVAERSKNYEHAAHIMFTKSERSELAEWAANNL
jgi:PhoH-like ATPase